MGSETLEQFRMRNHHAQVSADCMEEAWWEAKRRVEWLEEGYRDIWRCDLCEPCRDVIRCVADEQLKEALEESDGN